VLRIPSTSSPEALYGVAVHYALKKSFDDAQRAGLEKLPELEVFLDHFRQELFRKNVQLSPKAYADALKLGAEQLPEYYRQRYIRFGGQLSAEIKTEKSLKAYYKGIPLKGVIDKICFNGSDDHKTLHLADYKTGKLDDSRFVSINKRNELGGSYYRQLVFYKILIEHADFSPYKVKSAEIDYLSPDDSNIFQVKTLELDEQDAEAVGNLISSSYERIMAQEFSEGCEKKYCKWCNFVKTQRSPDSFRDEEEELLDD
jgi:DNA helicase-2/ATP-dependent DNA helicase PcrA